MHGRGTTAVSLRTDRLAVARVIQWSDTAKMKESSQWPATRFSDVSQKTKTPHANTKFSSQCWRFTTKECRICFRRKNGQLED